MDNSVEAMAPRGASYNDTFYECRPEDVTERPAKPVAPRYEEASEMCMMRGEKILWSTKDGYRAWCERNGRSLNRLLDKYWAEHNAEIENIDPREQVVLLQAATKKHWLQKVFDFFGIKSVKMEFVPASNGTYAMSGGGCRPVKHPYKDVKAGCDKVKLDLKGEKGKRSVATKKTDQKSRIYFVLSHRKIKRICNLRGYKYVSAPKTTTCSPKYLFESGTVTTNIHWTDGVSKAVFDAAGQYYLTTATGYEIKDWRKHIKSIPVYFERCRAGRSRSCAGAVVVCLNEVLIKILTKPYPKGSSSFELPPSR